MLLENRVSGRLPVSLWVWTPSFPVEKYIYSKLWVSLLNLVLNQRMKINNYWEISCKPCKPENYPSFMKKSRILFWVWKQSEIQKLRCQCLSLSPTKTWNLTLTLKKGRLTLFWIGFVMSCVNRDPTPYHYTWSRDACILNSHRNSWSPEYACWA